MTTTTLPINQQVDATSNAVFVQDLVATGKLISQGTLTVDGNATITGTLTSTNSAPKTVAASGTTLALTGAQTGASVILSRAAGSTITLPAPVVGTRFRFYVGVVTTGGNVYKVITSAGTVFLAGGVYIDKALTVTRYAADGSTIVSINLNGTTTGGLTIGDYFDVTCITATEWSIEGTLSASGTLATPFATS